MEVLADDAIIRDSRVKATFKLGSETYSLDGNKGSTVSEELVSFKEKSMFVLKEYITKHNVPHDVPDELLEISSEDDAEIVEKPAHTAKSKKTKLT
ncbi:uncharacterized protein LOC126687143 [Mercurialis annua]|uniref:uncharacterized protein LOC126687143 n=1 Tax=Mercurialis annua TaxID=3986 RepID=UPI00215FE830|nr:uncharacterized protein LOC126687143 [Mercurialis annua]XP_050237508.1 uncharacterized protein LOC126687143 [Mercurialis annua]XP_050237509.1 uncharacterized protein LOC126687143 [Mercurialis annua]